jgi:hypothetical protein
MPYDVANVADLDDLKAEWQQYGKLNGKGNDHANVDLGEPSRITRIADVPSISSFQFVQRTDLIEDLIVEKTITLLTSEWGFRRRK